MTYTYEIGTPTPALAEYEPAPTKREIDDLEAVVLRITHRDVRPIVPTHDAPRLDN